MSGRASAEVTRALWDHLNHGATIAGAARCHGVHIRSLRRAKRRWEALPPDQRAKMLSPLRIDGPWLARQALDAGALKDRIESDLAGAIIGPARVVATPP